MKIDLSKIREIDFTALDYDTIQEELIEYIKVAQSNNGVLDDFLSSDAAMVFIDLFSYIGNLLSFRLDTLANEMYLPTANRMQSIINILELVSQKVRNPTASTVSLTAVPSTVVDSDITISPRYQFTTTGIDGNPAVFEIMNEDTDYFNNVIIPAGVTNYIVRAFSGAYESFDYISTGEPNQKIALPKFPVIEGSVKVSVTPVSPELLTPDIITSTRAVEVDTLVSEEADNIIYKVSNDEDGKVTLTFASELFGRIPPAGHTIHVDYRVGGGGATNVPVNAINFSASFPTASGSLVDIAFSNPDNQAVGGSDLESIESIKLRAPALVRSNGNLVTTRDYEAIIAGIGGVQDVFAVDAFEDITKYNSKFGVPSNSVYIYVLPDTGGEISPDLRQVIAQEIEARRLSAIENFIFNPVYNDWELKATIKVADTADPNTVQSAVRDALLSEYGRDAAKFNNNIRMSQVIAIIQAVDDVDYVTLTEPATDIVADENEALRLLQANITLTVQ